MIHVVLGLNLVISSKSVLHSSELLLLLCLLLAELFSLILFDLALKVSLLR